MYYNNEESQIKKFLKIKKLLYQQKQNRSIIFLEKYKYLRQNIIYTAKSVYLNDIYKYGNNN